MVRLFLHFSYYKFNVFPTLFSNGCKVSIVKFLCQSPLFFLYKNYYFPRVFFAAVFGAKRGTNADLGAIAQWPEACLISWAFFKSFFDLF
jgi:hypothetical protein